MVYKVKIKPTTDCFEHKVMDSCDRQMSLATSLHQVTILDVLTCPYVGRALVASLISDGFRMHAQDIRFPFSKELTIRRNRLNELGD